MLHRAMRSRFAAASLVEQRTAFSASSIYNTYPITTSESGEDGLQPIRQKTPGRAPQANFQPGEGNGGARARGQRYQIAKQLGVGAEPPGRCYKSVEAAELNPKTRPQRACFRSSSQNQIWYTRRLLLSEWTTWVRLQLKQDTVPSAACFA
jgi:hypothetical protein